ncbi:hypothetical protein AAMO2058_000808800 [Amorphochlora amoebiformis]
MPRQKKRKNGGGDKKRKDRPKSESKKTTYPPNPQSPAEPPNKHQGASLRGTTSWIDELCRIDPDKLSPKIREMLSLASEPMQKNYVETPYRNGGRSCPSQANQNSASPSQRAGTSKAWLLDRKHSSAGRKYPRFQTLNDEFVGASLAGDIRRLVHLRCQVAINATNQKWGWTALMAAAGNGHLNCVRYLVKCKACINLQERTGWTALMLAARGGNLKVVEYLIREGADIKPRSSNEQTVYGIGNRAQVGLSIQRGLKARIARDKHLREQKLARPKPILDWEEDDVCRWLKEVGCSEADEVFRENMMDGEALMDVSEQDLDELGIRDEKLRDRLSEAITRLRTGPD